ncbi:MAG: CoA pyrophosphatase [Deltaproteobacteria bacterium]|nr:CoA pyrophosphatase [Deltaproteobacteria bacterium]
MRANRALSSPVGALQRSAVLVPLRRLSASSMDLVLTRRSTYEGSHSGQVSFPGGRMEPTDADAVATALREAEEELGIRRAAVEVIGRLDDMPTITGYHVAPVVGLLDPACELTPDLREVARVFTLPLEVLLAPEAWELRPHQYGGSEYKIWHLPYDGEDIWGVTAFILRGMVETVWAGEPSPH